MASNIFFDRVPTPRANQIIKRNSSNVEDDLKNTKPIPSSKESFRTPQSILDRRDDSDDASDTDEEETLNTHEVDEVNPELFKRRTRLKLNLESARKKKTDLTHALKYAKNLPDRGQKIREKIVECEEEILVLTAESAHLQELIGIEDEEGRKIKINVGSIEEEKFKQRRRKSDQMEEEETNLTVEAMLKIHESLKSIPPEDKEEEQPSSLAPGITLFPHQRQGLAWLLWRETQEPSGGILADDMGLGKTLTMISLILKTRELEDKRNEDKGEEKDDTREDERHFVKSNPTLIICPASVIGQWEMEVKSKVQKDTLNMFVYHGSKRKRSAEALAKHDIILTTYGTVQSEVKSEIDRSSKESEEHVTKSELLQIVWERIILDEAHEIRNPSTKTSRSVCLLNAKKRWCLTGTPIQNKESDLYSLLRFLNCHPFDEYQVWKRCIENSSDQGQERMNTLVKTLLLRRTKNQTSKKTGRKLVELPAKHTSQHIVTLTPQEKKVYDKVFGFSQNALQNYMTNTGKEVKEKKVTGSTSKDKESRQVGTVNLMSLQHGKVKAHHLLVLLLRLRQICCHPSLITNMLDQTTKAGEGIEEEGDEIDLISAMGDINLSNEKGNDVLSKNVLDVNNSIFDETTPSSKMQIVIQELRKILKDDDTEKSIIVSQWTSLLSIMKLQLKAIGIECVEINGQVDVKQRGGIVENFNNNQHGPRVMLLSLAAGGVGLNLVGANHLFLLDLHWNPQLEAQACDRIYRVGQTREVSIHRYQVFGIILWLTIHYRFVVESSIEERILQLQQRKINLAEEVLGGAKRTDASKLSIEDLKMLFQVT